MYVVGGLAAYRSAQGFLMDPQLPEAAHRRDSGHAWTPRVPVQSHLLVPASLHRHERAAPQKFDRFKVYALHQAGSSSLQAEIKRLFVAHEIVTEWKHTLKPCVRG